MASLNLTTLVDLTTTIAPNITNGITRVMFTWYDYSLFSLMLLFSAFIGIYFGCFGSKQSTTNEYLLGSREMKVIPIAISLVASHTSGITILGVPADVYRYGVAYYIGALTLLFVGLLVNTVYLPVFYKLEIKSTYEYLERRFDDKTRKFASFLFALCIFLFLPIVIYVPSLAFSAASGISIRYVAPAVCGVCIFYTTLGGLKAVVWTDTLQFVVTIGAIVTVLFLGIHSTGGLSNIFAKAAEGNRMDIFDFSLDLTKRDSFFVVVIGFPFLWISHAAANQGCVQKFLSVPSLRDAQRACIYFTVGMVGIKTISVLTGMIMFAKYSDCDPFLTGEIRRNDQLLPHYVMDVAGHIPGLPGLFIAGVLSAALSTLSAHLNCLAGTLYEDFVSKWLPKGTTEKTASNILKMLVVLIGVICTVLVFVVEHLGGVLPLAIALSGVTAGPALGLFTLGMLFPQANKRGAFYGGICGLTFISVITFGAQYYTAQHALVYSPKPLSADNCTFPVNQTILEHVNATMFANPDAPHPFVLFRVSYYLYGLIGTVSTIICGLLISLVWKSDDPPVHKDLLSPVIYPFLPKEQKKQYYTVEKALHIVTNGNNMDNDNNK